MEILDILIIGAGPIGLNCALEAKKNKLDYLIIEK
jgi:thioredoxin reductase (NADPH)